MKPTMTYVGLDGTRLDFPIPRGINRHLVASAIKKIHGGRDADLALRGLTPLEYDLALQVITALQEHRLPETV